MAILENTSVRGALLPAAASIAGAGIGLVLTRKHNGTGIGDLADDLFGRLGSAMDKAPVPTPSRSNGGGSTRNRGELEQQRRARAERRSQRRSKR
jgi:hypothetical protein